MNHAALRRNRTREAGSRDEVEGVVASTVNLYRNGAVRFIDWLDDSFSMAWGEATVLGEAVALE